MGFGVPPLSLPSAAVPARAPPPPAAENPPPAPAAGSGAPQLATRAAAEPKATSQRRGGTSDSVLREIRQARAQKQDLMAKLSVYMSVDNQAVLKHENGTYKILPRSASPSVKDPADTGETEHIVAFLPNEVSILVSLQDPTATAFLPPNPDQDYQVDKIFNDPASRVWPEFESEAKSALAQAQKNWELAEMASASAKRQLDEITVLKGELVNMLREEQEHKRQRVAPDAPDAPDAAAPKSPAKSPPPDLPQSPQSKSPQSKSPQSKSPTAKAPENKASLPKAEDTSANGEKAPAAPAPAKPGNITLAPPPAAPVQATSTGAKAAGEAGKAKAGKPSEVPKAPP
eukprot:s3482_g8.t1